MTKDEAKTFLGDIIRLVVVIACVAGGISAIGLIYDQQAPILNDAEMHLQVFGLASIFIVAAGAICFLMFGFRQTTPWDRLLVIVTSGFSAILTVMTLKLPMLSPELTFDMPGTTAVQFVVAGLCASAALAIGVELIYSWRRTPYHSELHRTFFAAVIGSFIAFLVRFVPALEPVENYWLRIAALFGIAAFALFSWLGLFPTRRPKDWKRIDLEDINDQ